MNHHQRKVLHAIFAHPLNANLEMKDIVNVLNGLGAEIDTKSKSRVGVTLNGRMTVLHLSSHSLLKAEVMQIRKFLEFLWDYGRCLSGLANTLTPRSTGYAAADTTHSAHERAGCRTHTGQPGV